MVDPTIESLKRFDKSDEWIVVPNVPMMTPHERTNADGTTKYKVDLTRLEALAKTMDQIETEDGVLPKIHAGHTVKDGPEPEILGYVKNRRVGKWGPAQKDGLLGDMWFHKDKFTKANGLPFRSAEFYPSRNQISAVALLSRDPELDMGMVLCQRDEGCEYYHLREPSMPDATPVATTTSTGTSTAPLPVSRDVDEAVRMAREEMAIEMKRQTDTIVRLEKEVQAERYHRRCATSEQQVTQLQAEGFVIKNRPALVERLAKLDDEGAKAELTVIRENYQRVPLDQPPVRVAEGVGAPEKQMTREDYERAVSYATQNKVSFEEAVKVIKAPAK